MSAVTACSSHATELHLAALQGTAVGGQAVGANERQARVLVVTFMGSWCPPCQAEADGFASVADDYKAAGVRFVGVAERDSRTSVRQFVISHHIHYPVINDDDSALLVRVAPQAAIPTTYIFRDGRFRQRLFGAVPYTTLRRQLDLALRDP